MRWGTQAACDVSWDADQVSRGRCYSSVMRGEGGLRGADPSRGWAATHGLPSCLPGPIWVSELRVLCLCMRQRFPDSWLKASPARLGDVIPYCEPCTVETHSSCDLLSGLCHLEPLPCSHLDPCTVVVPLAARPLSEPITSRSQLSARP